MASTKQLSKPWGNHPPLLTPAETPPTAVLAERLHDAAFCQQQQRRGQTGGRVGIFKNQFLGRPLRAKSFGHREERVAWGVLTPNLWVLARQPQASAATAREAA